MRIGYGNQTKHNFNQFKSYEHKKSVSNNFKRKTIKKFILAQIINKKYLL